MTYTRLIIFCAIFLLVGAGCAKKNVDTTVPDDTIMTLEQQAYVFCTNHGYTIKIVQNEDLRTNIYCDNGSTLPCLAIDFLQDTCEEEQVLSFFGEEITEEKELAVCSTIAKPVCGTDNRTYANACIATQLAVVTKHEGPCDYQINTSITPTESLEFDTRPKKKRSSRARRSRNTSEQKDSTQTTGTAQPESSESTTPDWLTTSLSLFDSDSKKTVAAYYCPKNGTSYYLVDEHCTECLKSLYNEHGNLVCYPSHDFDNSCPSDFLTPSLPAYCTKMTL